MIGIYKITNKLNNKNYIGQAQDIQLRFEQHKSCLVSSNKSWYPIAREESDSIDDFSFEILQECKSSELDELEEYWINYYDSYNNGYNRTSDGQGISTRNTNIKLLIQYTSYKGNFSVALACVLKALTKIKSITYSDKLLIVLFLTQLENKKPYYFNESWINQTIGLSHDTYMNSRKRLTELGILICDNRVSLILSIDNLLKIGE